MDNNLQTSQKGTIPDTRYLAYVMVGLKNALKKMLKEAFQEVLSEQRSMTLEDLQKLRPERSILMLIWKRLAGR